MQLVEEEGQARENLRKAVEGEPQVYSVKKTCGSGFEDCGKAARSVPLQMSDAVSCTVLRTCRIASRSSSEVSIEEEEDAIPIEAAIGRGQGVRLVKSTGDSPSDDVEVLICTEEPAVAPEEGFAAFDSTGSSTSIATSALHFDRKAGGFASAVATAGVAVATGGTIGEIEGALPSLQVTRTL